MQIYFLVACLLGIFCMCSLRGDVCMQANSPEMLTTFCPSCHMIKVVGLRMIFKHLQTTLKYFQSMNQGGGQVLPKNWVGGVQQNKLYFRA